MATGIGHTLAKVLGIKLNYRDPTGTGGLSRGESVFSVSTADTYVEEEPTALEWIQHVTPTPRGIVRWAYHLFPFTHWITRYNGQWLFGDLVAGTYARREISIRDSLTLGHSRHHGGLCRRAAVHGVRQTGDASSGIWPLLIVYGGVDLLVLCHVQGYHDWCQCRIRSLLCAIADMYQPVAVMSLIVGNVLTKIKKTHPELPGHVVASALAVICGAIIAFIGLIRMGWIVEFISLAAISAFMTGSALNIAVGQVPNLMGITGFDTRASTYKVVINILKHLGRTKLDAAMGLTALVMLYGIRAICNLAAKRAPSRAKLFFFISTLRTAFVILLYTLISYLVNRHHRPTKQNKFAITGSVPRGKVDSEHERNSG